MDVTSVVPSEPRDGSYLAVFALTSNEGGGEVRVEVEQCGTCFALVSTDKLDAHEGRHDAEAASGPPGSTPKAR